MYRDNVRLKLFTRRTAIAGGLKLVLFGVLAGRMYQLQVLESDRYALLAEENRINLRLLPPPRGRILDRTGVPLAVNRENYRVQLVAEKTDSLDETLDELAKLIPLSPGERQRIVREVKKHRRFVPVTVRENLDWEEVSRIEVAAPDLPGIGIDVGQSREYPFAGETAHILGYVAAVSEQEQNGDPLLDLPGFRIGKNGIEKVYEENLRGKGGTSQVEVNAVGRIIRELERQEGQPGQDMVLTIDMALQSFAVQRLSQEVSAATVLLDARNGDVLALASTPAYDPNEFAQGLSSETWRSLLRDPRSPLINKSIAGTYAPGSTFKVVVTLAALEAGVMPVDTEVYCRGFTQFGNTRFHCWKKHGHGSMAMIEAIQHSCDVYFYEVARRVGVDRIEKMARRMGLGEKVGIDLPNEKPGLIPTQQWKLGATGVKWQNGETLITGIGQGFVLTTPLQLAVMTARVANGGLAVRPRLVRPAGAPPGARDAPPIGIPREHLAIVVEGMNRVCNHERGTAFRARIREPGMEMAGKTGTSQVRRISKRERDTGVVKNEDKPWEERDHAVFIGFAPVRNARYACAVLVEHGGGGSAVAAPIARDILIEAQKRDPAARDPHGARLAEAPAGDKPRKL
jgi:penicillin-binding protein 2